jgi:hypothetical protein
MAITNTTETKNTSTENQSKADVIFVDPNRDLDLILYGGNNSIGRDLMIPPEDLCIAVQLEVSVPDAGGIRNSITIEWQSSDGKEKISFFEGKYIGGQYVLTDYYHDISFNSESVTGGGENEALGIRSINIEYNSWYMPEISMEFVDVRGMALMNPIDSYKQGNIENGINSFFSAFYTIPYPHFKLLVKGFYGNSVTYDLLPQDIRTTFDAQTGNVIISAKFVGFSLFSTFSDIPFNWIKSAPYNKYAQNDHYNYWEDQIKNGRFTFDPPSQGIAIPTFAELYDIIQKTIRLIKKLYQDDDSAIKKTYLDTAYRELNLLSNRYTKFRQIILDNTKVQSIDDTTDGVLIVFSPVSDWMEIFKDKNDVSSYGIHKEEIISSVDHYNLLVRDKNLGIPGVSAPPLVLEPFNIEIDRVNEDGNNITETVNKYTPTDKTDEYVVKYNLQLNTEYFIFELKYLAFKNQIDTIIETEIEHARNQVEQDLTNKTFELVKNSINFLPTIGNMTKLFFAHLEMFFYSYFVVINKTRDRKCSDWGAPPEQIDATNDGKDTAMLPPWFGIESRDEEGKTKCWPGSIKVRKLFKTDDTWKDLEEIKFLKYFNRSILDYNKRIEQTNISLSQIDDENIWLPVNPFDVSNTILITGIHSENPYKQIIIDGNGINIINDIIKEVGVRMFYGVGTWDAEGSESSTLAKAEAMNVFTAIKDQGSISQRLESYIKEGTLNPTSMVGVWAGGDNIIGADNGTKINEITENNLLAPDENSSQYIMLEYLFNNNIEGFVLPFASIGLNQYANANSDRQIVDDQKRFFPNEGVPLFYTHSNLRRSTWGGKYKVIFNIQPYRQSIDNFIKNISGRGNDYDKLVKNWDTTTSYFPEFFSSELNVIGSENAYNKNPFGITEKNKKQEQFEMFFVNLTKEDKKKVVHSFKIDNTDENGQTITRLEDAASDETPLFDLGTGGMVMKLKDLMNNRRSSASFVVPYFELPNKKNIFTMPEYYDLNKSENNNIMDSNYKKGILLLWTLGIDFNYVYHFLQNSFKFSCLKRLPKVVLLYLGAESFAWGNNPNKPNFSFDNYSPNKPIASLKDDIRHILEEYFKDWVKNYGVNILSSLELTRNGKPFSSGKDFKGACEEVIEKGNERDPQDPLAEDLFNVFGDRICDTYSCAHFVNGQLNVLLKPSSAAANSIMKLMGEDDLVISTHYQIFDEDGKPVKRNLTVPSPEGYATAFLDELGRLFNLDEEESNIDPEKPTEITNNEENIYNTKYYQFKRLYDRWLSWDSSRFDDWKLERFYDNKRTDSKNPAAITIIDKFYCDIANILICNLDVIGNIMEDINNEELSFLSILSNLFEKHKLLLIPTPNKIGITTQQELLDVFKPYTYKDMDPMTVQPGYTAIYVGESASQPSTGDFGKGRKFKDDTLNITGKDFPSHNIPPTPKSYGNVKSNSIPVFCVSYGKQNQQFFKIANLTTTNPIITEQSIKATENILLTAKGQGTVTQHTGQDLYQVYSATAYTAEIEMMGCAKIMPLMYFQLSNVYLFTGAYMIFKMSHNITPGKMTTKFTGIKQTFNRTDLMSSPFFAQTLIDSSSDRYGNKRQITVMSKEETHPPTLSGRSADGLHWYGPIGQVTQISDEITIDYAALKNTEVSHHYTLAQCVEADSINSRLAGNFDNAGEDMPPGVYYNLKEFMKNVDEIRDFVRSEGKYIYGNGMCDKHNGLLIQNNFSPIPRFFDIHLESVWRRYDDNDTKVYQTYHGYGTACDIHLMYNGSKANPRDPVYSFIYKFIAERFKNQITELLYEYKGDSRWVHYAWTPSSSKKPFISDSYYASET